MLKKIKAFTLIELMIVISIIAILAAILIPNLMRANQTTYVKQLDASGNTVAQYTAKWVMYNESGDIITFTDSNGVRRSFSMKNVEVLTK